MANQKFGKEYEFLTKEQRLEVREVIPKKLSEAEPTSFGEE